MIDRTENRSSDDVKQPIEHSSSFEAQIECFRTSTKFQTNFVALLGSAFDKIEKFQFPPPPKTTLETRVWRGFFERNVEIKNPEYNELVIRKFHINPFVGVLEEPETLPILSTKKDTSPNDDYLLLREFQNKEWAIDTVASGVKLAKEGKYHEAIRQYDHALEIYGKCKEAFIARGAALANTGAYYKAVDEFKKALEIDPEHSNARTYLEATLDKIKTENLTQTETMHDKRELSQLKRDHDHSQEDLDDSKCRSKKKHKKEKSRKRKKKKSRRHSRRYDSDDSEDYSDNSYRSRSPSPDGKSRSRSAESRTSGYSHRHRSRKANEHHKSSQRSQASRSRSPPPKENTSSHRAESERILSDKQNDWQHYGPEKIDMDPTESKKSKDYSPQQARDVGRNRSPSRSSRRRSHHRSRSRSRDYHKDRHYRR